MELDKVIESAHSTKKLVCGTNVVTKAIERNKVSLVILATDVNPPEIVMHIPFLCRENGIEYVIFGSKEEIGGASIAILR